jgi:hypothetical protein
VEMAGLEPASERFDPRIYYERIRSRFVASGLSDRQNQTPAIR